MLIKYGTTIIITHYRQLLFTIKSTTLQPQLAYKAILP